MPGTIGTFRPGCLAEAGIRTLPDLYHYAIENFSSRVVMKKRHSWGYQSISFQEFGKLISFLGSGLMDRGLGRGDRVALMADNSPEWVVTYAAVTSCGATIIPLDPGLQENELRYILLHSTAKMLVVSPAIYHNLIEGNEFRDVEIIVLGEKDQAIKSATVTEIMASGKEKIGGGDAAFFSARTEVEPGDVAAICYTSGTTGNPKAAVLLQSNLVSNVESIMSRLLVESDDVFLSLLPLHHTFSTMCLFFLPVLSGSTVVFARSRRPKLIIEDIMNEGITILVAVPLFFEHLAPMLVPASGGKRKPAGFFKRLMLGVAMKLGRLFGKTSADSGVAKKIVTAGMEKIRFCASGAAALRGDVEDAFSAAGIPLVQGYGLTEASPVISMNPLDRIKKGTIGPALPGIEVRIDSPGEDGIGEIIAKGPNVMKEYYKNPEATQETLRGGYLYTGDLGSMDEDGYITISGRKKCLIVTAGGKNVYPDELEGMLGSSPYILECIVMAVEDRKGNTRPGAVIVPNYDMLGKVDSLAGDMTEESVRTFIDAEVKKIFENVPDYKRLLGFQLREQELPKTSTRKVKRHMVKWLKD